MTFCARPSRSWLFPAVAAALAACGGDGGTPPPKPPPVTAPAVEALAASNVGATAMRLNGRVNANNGSAIWRFEYGTTAALGSTCNGPAPATGATPVDVSCDITGLPQDATVFYRLTAQNTAGTSQSGVVSAPLLSSSGITVSSVSPSPMVEGSAATLTGTGFSTAPGATTVLVDGRAATVTAVTATSVTFTVPAGACRPQRDVPVVVGVGVSSAAARMHPVRPASFASLAIGEQRLLKGEACLQLAPASAPEEYLVGVQNFSESGSSVVPATFAVEAAAAAGPAPAILPAPRRSTVSLAPARLDAALRSARRVQHNRAEQRLRQWEREHFGGLAGRLQRQSGGARRAVIPATAAVGDTFNFRVPDLNGTSLCQDAIGIRAVVRKVGARGIWMEDVANPAGGFTAGDYQELSDLFDNYIYATDVQYFGQPTDLDGNGRIVIMVTKEVNRSPGVLGFVFTGDLVPQSQCAQSNVAEVYYAIAPDPAGTVGSAVSLEKAREDAPSLIAHEFAHILQMGTRLYSPTTTALQTVWEAEGQATLAEEVVGHAFTVRQPGQNYGLSVAFPSGGLAWYQDPFVDLALYFGFLSATERVTTAPEECTWLARPSSANPQPCLGSRSPYGVSWSFLRFLSDQYGPGFPGGEAGFHRALVDDSGHGFGTMSGVTAQGIDVLLARWAAALYLDDRISAPQLSFTSWNLLDVYGGLVATARLTPRDLAFATFSHSPSVRGGSSAYYRLSGASRPATAVSARSASGGALPAEAQMWVVRVQ